MGTKRIMNPEEFLAAVIGEPVDFPVEGVGVVQVRGLTVMERKQIRPYIEDNEDLTVQVLVRGMVNPKLEAEHADQLYEKDNRKCTAIARKILQLSADEDEDELEKKVGSGSSKE